jgi:hypothetical protein
LVDSQQRQRRRSELREIANKEGQTAGAILAHIMPKHPMPVFLTQSGLPTLRNILSMRKSG